MKIIKLITAVILLITILFFSACEMKKTRLPHSTGKTSEMLVVTNNKAQWNSKIGEKIKEFFGQEQICLPQPEPLFTMFNIPEKSFSKMFKPNRNIFIVDINNKIEKPQIESKKDFWAIPQRVIKITAPNDSSFIKIFNENKEAILSLYQEVERERINKAFASIKQGKVIAELDRNLMLTLSIPSGYKVAVKGNNFMWIRKETLKESQGIIIYCFNYTDTNSFNLENIIAKRNEITKKYIPGPTNDSYMQVSEEVILPVAKQINFNDQFAIETRGLWKVEGDFMGGPFLSYTLIDELRNRVITIDAYVYAPKDNKRNLLLQLEAILHTFKISEIKE